VTQYFDGAHDHAPRPVKHLIERAARDVVTCRSWACRGSTVAGAAIAVSWEWSCLNCFVHLETNWSVHLSGLVLKT